MKKRIIKELVATITLCIVLGAILVYFCLFGIKKQTVPWYIHTLNMDSIVKKYDGAGVTIAILDSGISDSLKEELGSRITYPYNVLKDDIDVSDECGHGTMITSFMALDKYQLARKAKIMPIVVANEEGRIKIEDLVAGIQYAVDYGADIINISMGCFNPNEELENAIHYAYSQGVYVCAAVGDYEEDVLLYPARYQEVISVCAQSSSCDLYKYSNFNNDVNFCIPGEGIRTQGLQMEESLSGSSIATGYFSAILALFLQRNKDYSFEEIYAYLEINKVNYQEFMDMGLFFKGLDGGAI